MLSCRSDLLNPNIQINIKKSRDCDIVKQNLLPQCKMSYQTLQCHEGRALLNSDLKLLISPEISITSKEIGLSLHQVVTCSGDGKWSTLK